MNEAYFCWLIRLIGDDYIAANYQKLLRKLYSMEYVWELVYDKNRAADGLYLRKIFDAEMGSTGILQPKMSESPAPCSVLEMLIALARSAENNIMHDPDYGDRSPIWFWEMLENLGLDIYDDYNYYESEVDKIMDIFLHRRYATNGVGGAFPVTKPAQNMRQKDLWWQMNAYLEERFPI